MYATNYSKLEFHSAKTNTQIHTSLNYNHVSKIAIHRHKLVNHHKKKHF